MANEPTKPSLGRAFTVGIFRENPVFMLMIGMCPPLAVTTAVKPALTMGVCVTFVLVCSNLMISLMRNLIKPHLRIMMFTLTIAAFVTVAELALKAYLPDMSEVLGIYVPLIIVNCIIICRAEVCAIKEGPAVSLMDALGMGIGETLALGLLGAIREVLGTGQLMGLQVLGDWFVPWAALVMPVGAFVTLGLLLGLVNRFFKARA